MNLWITCILLSSALLFGRCEHEMSVRVCTDEKTRECAWMEAFPCRATLCVHLKEIGVYCLYSANLTADNTPCASEDEDDLSVCWRGRFVLKSSIDTKFAPNNYNKKLQSFLYWLLDSSDKTAKLLRLLCSMPVLLCILAEPLRRDRLHRNRIILVNVLGREEHAD